MKTNLEDYIGKDFGGIRVLKFSSTAIEPAGRPINIYLCQLPCGHKQKVNQRTLQKGYKPKCEECKINGQRFS